MRRQDVVVVVFFFFLLSFPSVPLRSVSSCTLLLTDGERERTPGVFPLTRRVFDDNGVDNDNDNDDDEDDDDDVDEDFNQVFLHFFFFFPRR